MADKKLSAIEELNELGFEIFDYSTKNEKNGLKKITLIVQFYNDGSWVIDSSDTNGMNSTLDSGIDLNAITKSLYYYKHLFLKALKEE